jgi:asparagine synthase (glutamine-hydrolysing)
MCGIAGIIGINNNQSQIDAMCSAMKHRGPDATGTFVENIAALGHVRLSIIDLTEGANQPFIDNSNRYVIVFNGEIYNFQEVKSQLAYDWKTQSDTEVILAAYLTWGKNCLAKLNGMFAFAIWDREKSSLFMARDRMGIKPFYYSLNNGVLVFGSEIRSILTTGLVDPKIDRKGLYEFLNRIAVRTPGTIIEGLVQLLPGHSAVFENGTLTTEAYWKLLKPIEKVDVPESYEIAKIKTFDLFEQSIRRRMVADVKVGAFLSGGIDSSAVVALMAKNSANPVETFSIIFDEKEFDESEYARMIAEKYATNHTEIKLKPEMLIEELPGFFKDMDSPTVDGINTYLVSKLVKQTGIKVVLTGLGGDELFAGYKNFIRWKKFKSQQWLYTNWFSKAAVSILRLVHKSRALSKIHDLQSTKKVTFSDFYNNSRSIFLKKELDELMDTPSGLNSPEWVNLKDGVIDKLPTLSQFSVGEMSNYTLDVLIKDTDQMSMAWALEVREPFFDYPLIEYMLGVPDHFKYDPKTPKSLLVKAMGKMLPEDIVYRPKKGFSFPWDYWMRNELKAYCEEAINSLNQRGLFKKDAVISYWNKFMAKDATITWSHIWSFVVLENWMKQNSIKI